MLQLNRCFIVVLALGLLGLLAVPALAADKIEATITEVADGSVTATDNDLQGWQFKVDNSTKVFINGQEGKLSDLKPGDTVTINHEAQQEDAPRATEIRLERK